MVVVRRPVHTVYVPVRRRAVVVASLVLVPVVSASLIIYWFIHSGTPFPLWDEWHCSRGEAPADFDKGGGSCYPDGATLPVGTSWDPLGNRPFVCQGRRGWTVIHQGTTEDCLRDGRKLPEGWARGPVPG